MDLPVKFAYCEMLWQLVSQIYLLFLQIDFLQRQDCLFILCLTDGTLRLYICCKHSSMETSNEN